MTRELVFDAWTALTFKRQFGPRKIPGNSWMAPTWVGDDHQRRLLAYKVLQAYLDNAAREFLVTSDDERRNEHREYGDGALLRNAALSALLGDEQTITVQGAAEVDAADEGEDTAEAEAAVAQQEWLEGWADDERLLVKVQEVERDAVGLGDGVYTLGWSGRKGRPRLRIFDPGFYFPVLDDGNEDEFPRRVHVAWEREDSDGKTWVRRLTWELVPLPPGETRRVPYQAEPITETCLLSDGEWELKKGAGAGGLDDLSDDAARWFENEDGEEIRDLDLGVDFIPVVHISNTVAVKEHFGQSVVSHIAQVLDDVANADTDLAAAAGTTGTPPISISGAPSSGTIKYRPGTVFKLGDGGRMDVLDTSRSLDALLKFVESLLQRLSTNGRLPAALLGRVNPSEVPSGVALALSFGPLTAMVREMRLARREKYRLLFKFVHRLALVGGVPELSKVHAPTDLDFGSFLPNDEAAATQLVTRLLEAQAISLEQAVMILRAAGITERDQADEIEAIQGRDFEGANRLFDATGMMGHVLEYLAREELKLVTENGQRPPGGTGGGAPGSEDEDGGVPTPATPPVQL